jgi:polyhydroxybutyrate depolymerase
MLHGYSASGLVEELYLDFKPVADANGFLYAHPDGTFDKSGNRFWNATDGCCNFNGSMVDDSGYLSSVISEIEKAYSVDPKRVFIFGHSNGGFMSYRMACDHSDQIAAFVSLAGAMWQDTTKCQPKEPVSMLEIHGTADMEVPYDGYAGGGGPGLGAFPSAKISVKDWAVIDGCTQTPDDSGPPLDLDTSLPGAETTDEKYAQGCKAGGWAELWSVTGAPHIPAFGDTFRKDVFDFFATHPKP